MAKSAYSMYIELIYIAIVQRTAFLAHSLVKEALAVHNNEVTSSFW